jgi:aldehyde:ferredoxin oxidoreductase
VFIHFLQNNNVVHEPPEEQHLHLDNAGYSIDQKAAKKQLSLEQMVDEIIKEDNSRGVFNTLAGCLFARGVYTSENIIDALGAVGIEKTKDDLDDLGSRIFQEKYKFKIREGFDLSRVRIPRRFFETVSTLGKIDPQTVEEMLQLYRKKRGWLWLLIHSCILLALGGPFFPLSLSSASLPFIPPWSLPIGS